MNTLINEREACRYFSSLGDLFTSSRGLDHIFQDLNRGDETLRSTVLTCVANLMSNDDLICIKFLKLKLVSNVVKNFQGEEVHNIIKAFKNCKHRKVLL